MAKKTDVPFDYGRKDAQARDVSVTKISALATRQLELTADVARLGEALKAISAELRTVSEDELPAALAEAGIKSITLPDGSVVTVKDDYYCSLTGKYRDPALAWLREQGHDAVITRAFAVRFGKGEEKSAERLEKLLGQRKFPYKAADEVNTGTFKAIVREQVEAGERVPLVRLGVRVVPQAHIRVKS